MRQYATNRKIVDENTLAYIPKDTYLYPAKNLVQQLEILIISYPGILIIQNQAAISEISSDIPIASYIGSKKKIGIMSGMNIIILRIICLFKYREHSLKSFYPQAWEIIVLRYQLNVQPVEQRTRLVVMLARPQEAKLTLELVGCQPRRTEFQRLQIIKNTVPIIG
ncbi:UNKNOWN [Stylonychia lemnae]|uniref:Uncharacterized protein n=1 Tax=Stylonychia lemnae TaxID=5949 RepID=A0A078A2C2_STYLE|nr:UNKNOWN [Stylonychia lemnae]|eukprot:CDW76351.1 UNKNOWN [Stylonychia lemnae]